MQASTRTSKFMGNRKTDRQTNRQTHRQKGRQTERQTDRQPNRRTDRHINRRTDRQTDRQTRRQTDKDGRTDRRARMHDRAGAKANVAGNHSDSNFGPCDLGADALTAALCTAMGLRRALACLKQTDRQTERQTHRLAINQTRTQTDKLAD